MTREQWLEAAVKDLRPLFSGAGHDIPVLRVSVGFPGGGSARKRIGEYWSPKVISDGIPQIFISPTLKTEQEHLGVLVHEVVHACVGAEAGHGPKFKKLALAVGLTGKMRATTETDWLRERLNVTIKAIGPIPHGAISLRDRKKQSTRLVKAQCMDCGHCVRTTMKWVDQGLIPICPCNQELMTILTKEQS